MFVKSALPGVEDAANATVKTIRYIRETTAFRYSKRNEERGEGEIYIRRNEFEGFHGKFEKRKLIDQNFQITYVFFIYLCIFFFQTNFLFQFIQDDEFHEMIHSAERIEFLYSHLFDETIVNADLSMAFEQLAGAISRVETEPLWVPASWVQ